MEIIVLKKLLNVSLLREVDSDMAVGLDGVHEFDTKEVMNRSIEVDVKTCFGSNHGFKG